MPYSYVTFGATEVTFGDVTKTVDEWAKEKKLKVQTVYERRRKGCDWEAAFRPLEKFGNRKTGFAKAHQSDFHRAIAEKKKKKPEVETPPEDRPKRTRFA